MALIDRFARPPAAARILKIIHPWPDQGDRQDELIRSLQDQGFGGVVCNVAFDCYLESDTKWAAFRRGVGAARQAGMTLWLYDEKGYPSGAAGGLVLRDHPEWEARGLLVADTDTGPAPVTLPVPPGVVVLVAAFPLRGQGIELDRRVDLGASVRDGRLDWTAPAGRWRVMAITEAKLFAGTHAEGNLSQKAAYPNLLEAPPTARFLELTHARYARVLGPDLGRTFVATFTDEPSLMSWFVRRMPYRPLPWSSALSHRFRERHGYALEPILPALVADAGAGTARYRHDFWSTVGELVSENYFGQIQSWCRAHNVRSGGHLLAEEGLTAHVPLYGDSFRCLRRLDAPGIDCLTSLPPEVPWSIARLAASAAELEGQPLVMCETSDHGQVYRPAGDTRPQRAVTEEEIRGTCNRLLVSGINVITSYYSFRDLAPDQLRRLNEWVGRCATLLTGGQQVADVAVVYPIESAWTRFTPAFHWANAAPGANRIEHLYTSALDSLWAARRDMTIIDSRTLSEAKVNRGELTHGRLRWRAVVLPGVDTLPREAWLKLEEFARSGGTVIALGARPANSETRFPDRRVQALADRLLGPVDDAPHARSGAQDPTGGQSPARRAPGVYLPAGSEFLLPAVLDQAIEPDVAVTDRQAPIRVTHRRVEGHEVYFLINDSPQPWRGAVRCRANGPAEQWHPATGTRSPWPADTRAELALEGYGGVFLRFPSARVPVRKGPPTTALADLAVRDLPSVQPTVARGEFVRETLVPDADLGPSDRPAWRVKARLTQGGVDTFLFVRLAYPAGLDLRAAEFLEVDTWVPPDQRTPTQLLVILLEEGGGDFLASTPRSLAAAGHERSFIPLGRFQLAGWSKDGDGVLDRQRIREIRIGWGGYLGTEGETVEFSFALPRAGQVTSGNRER